MVLVQADRAGILVVLIDDRDLVALLQQLDIEIPENIGHRILHALIVGIGIRLSGKRDFTALSDDLGRFGLQNGVRVIAHELEAVAGAVRTPLPIDERRGTRGQRLEPGIRMRPNPREIREGLSASALS